MTVNPISAGRVQSAIALASSKTGVDFDYLLGQAKIESGLNASARAGTSSASGLYQFVEQSWLAVVKKHGAEHGLGWAANSIGQTAGGRYTVGDSATRSAILNLRNDPTAASLMAAEHASDNKDVLEGALGRSANGTDLYMAHFLGIGGAKKFLSAMQTNPGATAASLFPQAAGANRSIFYAANGQPRTLSAIYQRFADKLGAAGDSVTETRNANLAVLMVSLNAQKPLDFSSFPTVLLFATLFRLGLNVASTRIVLVHGHEGESAAGHVIEAFGTFLIGGDYVVGIFVFAILMIINLIVVTKGAGRVSEVSARFTLDALPGKQMAIDADLNAGLITPEDAKKRRVEVSTEADFYGSMDGSSKFVKGDAVAALLILAANIIGGLILGPVSHGMTIAAAAKSYILLAIGDALVAQLPSLMLSIAAAAIVTRVSSDKDLAGQIGGQFGSPRTWTPVAIILGLLGLLPGMPHLVILATAGLAGFAAWKLRQIEKRPVAAALPVAAEDPVDPSTIGWDEVTDGMQVNFDIGYGLVPLVDPRRGAPLMGRITGVRRQLSRDLGFVVPQCRVRDDINLAPYTYRILVNGVVLGEDQVSPDEMLALDTGQAYGDLSGKKAKDPTFGLDATWIPAGDADAATGAGFLVVDAGTVMATHLNHVLGANATDLLGPDEVQSLLDGLKERAAQLVATLTPNPLPLTTLTQVLKGLLAENIPLKEFRRIAQAISVAATRSADAEEIIELIRPELGPLIIQKLCGVREPLRVMTLEGQLEGLLGQAARADQSRRHVIEPDLGRRIVDALQQAAQPLIAEAKPFALVVQPAIRIAIRKLVKTVLPDTPVLSFFEVPEEKAVEVVAVIGGSQQHQALAA